MHADHDRAHRLHRRLAGPVPAGAGDQLRPAGEVVVHVAGGPAQQLGDRPVAADDLDRRLGVAPRPLLQLAAPAPVDRDDVGAGGLGAPRTRRAGRDRRRVAAGLEVEGEGALDAGHGRTGQRSGTSWGAWVIAALLSADRVSGAAGAAAGRVG